MGIMVNQLSDVLWRGLEPSNSFSGGRDYARSAVASWTTLGCSSYKGLKRFDKQ